MFVIIEKFVKLACYVLFEIVQKILKHVHLVCQEVPSLPGSYRDAEEWIIISIIA